MIPLAASAAAVTVAPAPAASLPMLGPKWLDASNIISTFVGWIGPWAIVGVMLVIFAETGLLVGFLLPGDSLIFVSRFGEPGVSVIHICFRFF